MSGLLVAVVLAFTAITVVSLGIFAAYAAITGVLYALAPHSRPAKATGMLVASESHASGD